MNQFIESNEVKDYPFHFVQVREDHQTLLDLPVRPNLITLIQSIQYMPAQSAMHIVAHLMKILEPGGIFILQFDKSQHISEDKECPPAAPKWLLNLNKFLRSNDSNFRHVKLKEETIKLVQEFLNGSELDVEDRVSFRAQKITDRSIVFDSKTSSFSIA